MGSQQVRRGGERQKDAKSESGRPRRALKLLVKKQTKQPKRQRRKECRPNGLSPLSERTGHKTKGKPEETLLHGTLKDEKDPDIEVPPAKMWTCNSRELQEKIQFERLSVVMDDSLVLIDRTISGAGAGICTSVHGAGR